MNKLPSRRVKNQIKIKDPLKDIILPDSKIGELIIETGLESFIEAVPVIGKFKGALDKYQGKMNEAKLAVLLVKFKDTFASQEEFNSKMVQLFTTNEGIVLFQKIARILNLEHPGEEYINLLAKTLKNISSSDFVKLFDDHNYVLSQIEKLSPQSLLILSDKKLWPPTFQFPSTTTSGVTNGIWDTSFAMSYLQNKGFVDQHILNPSFFNRIRHAVKDLERDGFAFIQSSHLELTDVGKEVYEYLYIK